jgi:hypothetical protein
MYRAAPLALLALACTPSRQAPVAATARAEFVDGIILLDVTLEGKQGWWLLDSWARGVTLDISGVAFRLLGHDFFERHLITIDYARREVRLARHRFAQ